MADFVASQFSDLDGQAASGQLPNSAVQTFLTYADPIWITSLSGSKITGNIAGNAASITGAITESQVTGLSTDLANRPLTSSVLLNSGNQTLNNGTLTLTTTSTTSTPFVINVPSGQSAFIVEWNKNGTPFFSFDSGGALHLNNYIHFDFSSGVSAGLILSDTQTWYFPYRNFSDPNTYIFDQTNGRIHAQFSPGANAAAALTKFNTRVITEGNASSIASVNSTYSVSNSDSNIICDATTLAFTVTLPAANSFDPGREFTIKKIDGTANAVTVAASGTDKIDGAANYSLPTVNKYVKVVTNGSANWFIVANN